MGCIVAREVTLRHALPGGVKITRMHIHACPYVIRRRPGCRDERCEIKDYSGCAGANLRTSKFLLSSNWPI